MTKLFDHLVLDSGPLLNNNFPISLAENFYTVPSVIEEIRDESSRLRLAQLPFKLETRNPSAEALSIVTRFARATGDLAVLSKTDLQVIALSVTLDIEKNGNNSKMRRDASELPKEQTHEGVREYFAYKSKSKKDLNFSPLEMEFENKNKKKNRKGGVEVSSFDENPMEILSQSIEEISILADNNETNESDGNWITPENIKSLKSSTGESEWNSEEVKNDLKDLKTPKQKRVRDSSRIACITSDFAMQNVLLQMRLELYTPDGCRVKNVKNWLLRCHACFTTTRNMNARFCPKCGGPTLIRTSFMIEEDGGCHLFLRSDFQYNLRGTKYNLPKSKGGRQGASLILREDQKEFQRQKDHYERVQAKIEKSLEDSNSLEVIDDRIASVFGGGTVNQGNRRYDAYDGLALPVIGVGRRNPNAIKKIK